MSDDGVIRRGDRLLPTILVVDDDDDLRGAIFALLQEEARVRVAAVANGQQALDLLRGGLRPCVILLDLRMPEMGGVEFRREQLASPDLADIPVVVLTGDLREIEAVRELGVAFVLMKPVNLRQLLEVAARFCADVDRLELPPQPSAEQK
jgi:CheY-like chemotaxis protein